MNRTVLAVALGVGVLAGVVGTVALNGSAEAADRTITIPESSVRVDRAEIRRETTPDGTVELYVMACGEATSSEGDVAQSCETFHVGPNRTALRNNIINFLDGPAANAWKQRNRFIADAGVE